MPSLSTVEINPPGPALIYHQQFVPALFGQWGPRLAKQANVRSGSTMLDVGCGTGVLASAAADIAGDAYVTGVDINPEMLEVARQQRPTIDWRYAPAENLPFTDASFGTVLSQFALMFFDSRTQGLAEMWRVLEPGGTLLVAVCDGVHRSPGYAVFAEVLNSLFGAEVAESFRAPFSAGNVDHLRYVVAQAGIPNPRIEQQRGTVRFDTGWRHDCYRTRLHFYPGRHPG
ncbi:class I SAM-dependent methyltransferase [Marinobacter sp. OP 3.4]|uniref:class I SAM-dependent methyltransferase n=1 Tax=Marinobacter sp. OP 3.4 TaxID=3076501 RepID=UPI002E20DC63